MIEIINVQEGKFHFSRVLQRARSVEDVVPAKFGKRDGYLMAPRHRARIPSFSGRKLDDDTFFGPPRRTSRVWGAYGH